VLVPAKLARISETNRGEYEGGPPDNARALLLTVGICFGTTVLWWGKCKGNKIRRGGDDRVCRDKECLVSTRICGNHPGNFIFTAVYYK